MNSLNMKTKILPLALLAMLLSSCVEREVVYREHRHRGRAIIVEERGYAPYSGAVWVPGHWRDGVWIRGHWRHAY